MTPIPPSENLTCLGYDSSLKIISEAFMQDRLAPVWLLLGPEGIGKKTFAYFIARFLLAQGTSISKNTSFVRRIAAQTHPDFFIMKGEHVEDVRNLRIFLQKSAIEGQVRVAILPHVDLMTPSAVNALLKILEEPAEQTFFFLTASVRGAILPTLRSRCQILSLAPLQKKEFDLALQKLSQTQTFEISSSLSDVIWEKAKGCLGQAVRIILAEETADILQAEHLIEVGLVEGQAHYPFHPEYTKFWSTLSQERIQRIFVTCLENIFRESAVSSAENTSFYQQVWSQKTPLEWGKCADQIRHFLQDGVLYKCDSLAMAIGAWHLLMKRA